MYWVPRRPRDDMHHSIFKHRLVRDWINLQMVRRLQFTPIKKPPNRYGITEYFEEKGLIYKQVESTYNVHYIGILSETYQRLQFYPLRDFVGMTSSLFVGQRVIIQRSQSSFVNRLFLDRANAGGGVLNQTVALTMFHDEGSERKIYNYLEPHFVDVINDEDQSSTVNLVPWVVYYRVMVPYFEHDFENRHDDFYLSQAFPVRWAAGEFRRASLNSNDRKPFIDEKGIKFPENPVSEILHEKIAYNQTLSLHGSFIDSSHCLIARHKDVVAKYIGEHTTNIQALIGEDVDLDAVFFKPAKQWFVTGFVITHHSPIFTPWHNGIADCRVRIKKNTNLGKFYSHFFRYGYIYDRAGIVKTLDETEEFVQAVIKRDPKPYDMAIFETVEVPALGLVSPALPCKFSGIAFVASKTALYVPELPRTPIYYDHVKYNFLMGSYLTVSLHLNSETQRYELLNYDYYFHPDYAQLDYSPKNDWENKPKFKIPVTLKRDFYFNERFGPIGVLPGRKHEKTKEMEVYYVGHDLDSQVDFVEVEHVWYDDYYDDYISFRSDD